MNFKLVSLTGIKTDQEVYEVMLPTADGIIAVFPDHEPLVSIAVPGAISIRKNKDDSNDKMEHFAISGGVVEIQKNVIKVLVDEADHSDDIVEAEAKAALDRALEMKKNAVTQVEIDKAHELVDRHSVRLKVAELRRHKRR